MRVSVNGAALYLDVDGAGLIPEGSAMRERPAAILLHGEPTVGRRFYSRDREMERMDCRAAPGGVFAPAPVMAGEDDPITPPAFSEVIARAPPGAVLRRYDRCGHGVIDDRPDALDHLRAFVEGVAGRMN